MWHFDILVAMGNRGCACGGRDIRRHDVLRGALWLASEVLHGRLARDVWVVG